jgi:hypothetical protein
MVPGDGGGVAGLVGPGDPDADADDVDVADPEGIG